MLCYEPFFFFCFFSFVIKGFNSFLLSESANFLLYIYKCVYFKSFSFVFVYRISV